MSENYSYQPDTITDVLKEQIIRHLGEAAWLELTAEGIPHNRDQDGQRVAAMRALIAKLDDRVESPMQAKEILVPVRHGLKPEQFEWAVEVFAKCGKNIDRFIDWCEQDQRQVLNKYLQSGELFYGQPITSEVITYLEEHNMLAPVRKGSELIINAMPYRTAELLVETDPLRKRYCFCHCQFARESILSEEVVSPTLCLCSLGHAKILWDVILGLDLEGEVLRSVLDGDDCCQFILHLPEEVMAAYL